MHDLSEYDSGSWNTSYQLSEEEARIDALCDRSATWRCTRTCRRRRLAKVGGAGVVVMSWRTVDFWESALYQNRT